MGKIEIDTGEVSTILKDFLCIIGVIAIVAICIVLAAPEKVGPQPAQTITTSVVTAAPTPVPTPTLPQVLEVTVSQITYANGRYEVDGVNGQVLYFPDYAATQSIFPDGTYLFTPTGMEGSAYDVSDVVTVIQAPPFQTTYYGTGYTTVPWNNNIIYHSIDVNGNHYYRYERGIGMQEISYSESVGHRVIDAHVIVR